MDQPQGWTCQFCGFGPNSVTYNDVCPNCNGPRSKAAHLRSSQYFCSVSTCDHHRQGFSSKWRVIDHERQEHGYLWCQSGECAQDRESPLMSSEDLLEHWQKKHQRSASPSPAIGTRTSTFDSATLNDHDLSPYQSTSRLLESTLPLSLRLCVILVCTEFAVVLISLVIGTTWTLKTEPHDVQGGFTLGAWFLAAGTIVVAGIRHLHSKRCRCFDQSTHEHVRLMNVNIQG